MANELSLRDPHTVPTSYWHTLADGRIQCDVCPRACKLRDGQRGVCFVRGRTSDQIVLATYGRSSGYCIDPIEKKPLNHFLPGSAVLSFGTAGCNLACRFCQNWDISKSKEVSRLSSVASPDDIAQAAVDLGVQSVAFTYNDPVIFLEYAIDTADACRARGIRSVVVSAGYMCDAPRRELYQHVDAANIDLKAFSQDFYRHVAMGDLQPVLDTLRHLRHETDVWFEITTLLIPGQNDSDAELSAMVAWIVDELGTEVPLHFSAFHPDFKMLDIDRTPEATLQRARDTRSRRRHPVRLHRERARPRRCEHVLPFVRGVRDRARLVRDRCVPSHRRRSLHPLQHHDPGPLPTVRRVPGAPSAYRFS